MKAIFLDIDGVLNCYATNKDICSKSRCQNYIGIDKDKTKRLARIVKETNAILILSSSWKIGWEPNKKYDNPDDIILYYHAKYLNNHLKKKGKLFITDKTRERDLYYRGAGIKSYLNLHPEITDWIVLDDEIFIDFQEEGIMPHLIKINPIYGLTDDDAVAAIKMLNNQIIGPYNVDPHFETYITQYKKTGPANKKEK